MAPTFTDHQRANTDTTVTIPTHAHPTATMDLTGLRAEGLSALARGLDGDPGGGGQDAASIVASTDDDSGVTSIDATSTITSTDAASVVAVFGAFVVARCAADSMAAVDSAVLADFMAVVDTDKRRAS